MESFFSLPRLAIICIEARRYGGAGYDKSVGIDTIIKTWSSTQGSISLSLDSLSSLGKCRFNSLWSLLTSVLIRWVLLLCSR
jgi:hypothetical protein